MTCEQHTTMCWVNRIASNASSASSRIKFQKILFPHQAASNLVWRWRSWRTKRNICKTIRLVSNSCKQTKSANAEVSGNISLGNRISLLISIVLLPNNNRCYSQHVVVLSLKYGQGWRGDSSRLYSSFIFDHHSSII